MNRTVATAAGFVGIVVLFLVWQSFFIVDQRQQALVLQFGQIQRVEKEPGLKMKIPFIQDVVRLDKRLIGFDAPPEEIITADQRRLVVDTFVRFRITDPLRFYQSVSTLAGLRARLPSVVNSSVRGVLGGRDTTMIISGERGQIMNQIRDSLNGEARAFGIEVVDVRIRRADFPDAISQSIFERMKTERQREAKESRAEGFELSEKIRADAERQRTIGIADARRQAEILRGEGDAIRTKTLATAANQDPEFYAFYRSLQAYAQALQPGDTTLVLSPDSEFFKYFAEPPLLGGKK